MSDSDFVDWNQMVEEDEQRLCVEYSGEIGNVDYHKGDKRHHLIDGYCVRRQADSSSRFTVEHPDSSPEIECQEISSDVESVSSREDCQTDVLNLYCDETDEMCEEEEKYQSIPDHTEHRDQRTGSDDEQQDHIHYATERSEKHNGNLVLYKQPSRPARKRRRNNGKFLTATNTTHKRDQLLVVPRESQRRVMMNSQPGWITRWVRKGNEQLVYDICNCNEAPNVVFAGLCYLRSDVYTMVLRNCGGKRRYWYDRSTRKREHPDGAKVCDFERAMRWRAEALGRPSSSPGYDLAAFVLQNVVTDRRYVETSCTSRTPQLIVVTTDNTLMDSDVHSQLLYTAKSDFSVAHADRRRTKRSNGYTTCQVCRAPPVIVTHDNASVPIHTCWQHSTSHMACANAETTRVCNAVAVDVHFTRKSNTRGSELVCHLRSIVNGYPSKRSGHSNAATSGLQTIAELVWSPNCVPKEHHVKPDTSGSTGGERTIGLDTAHEATMCQDQHYNVEDLFPSMPVNRSTRYSAGGVGIHYYDTTVGLAVDRLHCITSSFQRC